MNIMMNSVGEKFNLIYSLTEKQDTDDIGRVGKQEIP
jgi:hypothetical protein